MNYKTIDMDSFPRRAHFEYFKGLAYPYVGFTVNVPWMSFTSVIQPTPSPADSNPRINWGRYFRQDGKVLLPLAVLCNHALVDGLHISRFYSALDRELAELTDRLGDMG